MYIHTPSKHRRSGTTMQKKSARGSAKRWLEQREVLSGFPWQGRFSSVSEIEQYLDGDEIECLLCGKPYRTLTRHLHNIHGMDCVQYKLHFNIPQKYPLMGKATRAIHRTNAMANDFMLVRALLPNCEKAPRRKRAECDLVKSIRADNARKAHKNNKPKYEDYSWHLEQVRLHKGFANITVPEGMAQWVTYKLRRRRDPELRKLHEAAINERRAKE